MVSLEEPDASALLPGRPATRNAHTCRRTDWVQKMFGTGSQQFDCSSSTVCSSCVKAGVCLKSKGAICFQKQIFQIMSITQLHSTERKKQSFVTDALLLLLCLNLELIVLWPKQFQKLSLPQISSGDNLPATSLIQSQRRYLQATFYKYIHRLFIILMKLI